MHNIIMIYINVMVFNEEKVAHWMITIKIIERNVWWEKTMQIHI